LILQAISGAVDQQVRLRQHFPWRKLLASGEAECLFVVELEGAREKIGLTTVGQFASA
jgi:hypothetical protein